MSKIQKVVEVEVIKAPEGAWYKVGNTYRVEDRGPSQPYIPVESYILIRTWRGIPRANVRVIREVE